MWSEQGIQVTLKSVANDTALSEYTNNHFQYPGDVTTSRLISGACGEEFQVCIQLDPTFRQYTANALKVEIVCHSVGEGGTTISQCYAIPLSNKHGGIEVTLDKWVRWDHCQSGPECGRVETAYSLPGTLSKSSVSKTPNVAKPAGNEEISCASIEWTRSYGVANRGCVVVNIIRGKLALERAITGIGDRGSLVPATPPENVVEAQPFVIDETWFLHLNSDNCPVLFAEFMNVQKTEGAPGSEDSGQTTHTKSDGADGSIAHEHASASHAHDEGLSTESYLLQGPTSSLGATLRQNPSNRQSDRPRRAVNTRNYAESPVRTYAACEPSATPSSGPIHSRRRLMQRRRPRIVHSESPEVEHSDNAHAVDDRRDQRAASNNPTAFQRGSIDSGLQAGPTRIKPEPEDGDDDCRFIEARAVTQNGPVTPRPTPSVISHGVSAHQFEGTIAAQTQISSASSKQRKRAKLELQLELETSLIKQKAALARIDAEAEFALQQKAIEKQLAELDEE